MTKVKKLGAIFISLLILSVILHFAGKKKTISATNKALFSIADTTQIQSLNINADGQNIAVVRGENQWMLNDKYKADPQLIYLFQRILQAVETQRPVSQSNFDVIRSELETTGQKVEITMADGSTRTFYVGGSQAKTTAYFANEDLSQIFIVVIPGYKTYVSGIFELTLNQWRDRTLFNSSWRTLQNLNIDYNQQNKQDLDISFDGQFLSVKDVNNLDTAAMMNYLQPLENFQLNDYLEQGSFPRYDSLLATTPLAKITVRDIDESNNLDLTVFRKIKGERFYLLVNDAMEMIVVDQGRMNKILAQPSAFMRQQ